MIFLTATPTTPGTMIQRVAAENLNSEYFDLINNPATVWTITRSDGQPDDETVTLDNGDVYKRTFTYNANGVLTERSKWVKQ